jgi:hypothetical protein
MKQQIYQGVKYYKFNALLGKTNVIKGSKRRFFCKLCQNILAARASKSAKCDRKLSVNIYMFLLSLLKKLS